MEKAGQRLMELTKLAMMLEMEYGIRTHMRFELVDGQGEPVYGSSPVSDLRRDETRVDDMQGGG